jgi:hypothetical protein
MTCRQSILPPVRQPHPIRYQGELGPRLAQSWGMDRSGLHYTFHLRPTRSFTPSARPPVRASFLRAHDSTLRADEPDYSFPRGGHGRTRRGTTPFAWESKPRTIRRSPMAPQTPMLPVALITTDQPSRIREILRSDYIRSARAQVIVPNNPLTDLLYAKADPRVAWE